MEPRFECSVSHTGPPAGEPGYLKSTTSCYDLDTGRSLDENSGLRYTFEYGFGSEEEVVRFDRQESNTATTKLPSSGSVLHARYFTMVEDIRGCYQARWTPPCWGTRETISRGIGCLLQVSHCQPTLFDAPPPTLTPTFGANDSSRVLADDLAAASTPTLAGIEVMTGGLVEGSTVGALNDGTVYAGGTIGETVGFRSFVPAAGTQIVITLNTALSPNGYDLTSIVVLSADAQDRPQDYDIEIKRPQEPDFVYFWSVGSSTTEVAPPDPTTKEVELAFGPPVDPVSNTATRQVVVSEIESLRFTFHQSSA